MYLIYLTQFAYRTSLKWQINNRGRSAERPCDNKLDGIAFKALKAFQAGNLACEVMNMANEGII